jgi:TRAP-type C4-dicarboxylate transport system permease small subunit
MAEPAPPRAVIGFVTAAANAVLAFALLGELATVFANVIARTFFDTAFLWADEIAKLALSTLAFIGGAIAYAANHHT